jgi:hypothetical protein
VTIFLSYNKLDRATANELALFLVTENVGVWFDEWEIAAGDSIVDQIESGLTGCSHYVILWSANAAKSEWVRRELRATLAKAIEDGSPRIIPVLLDETPLPPLLADIKWVRYGKGSETDRWAFIRAVTGHDASKNLIRAVVKKYHELVKAPPCTDTLGFFACPDCGSSFIEAWEDLEVDYDWSDGEVSMFPIFIPAVRCRECSWSHRKDQ